MTTIGPFASSSMRRRSGFLRSSAHDGPGGSARETSSMGDRYTTQQRAHPIDQRAVQYGIQRRSIYLIPPSGDDAAWLFEQFDDKEVWQMFGFQGPSRARMIAKHAEGNLVVGVVRRVETKRRIGFVIIFPPTE